MTGTRSDGESQELTSEFAQASDDFAAACSHARVLCDLGRPKECIELLSRLQATAPQVASAWVIQGNALKQLGQLGHAEACYRAVLELEPGHAEASFNLVVVLSLQGLLSEAECRIRRILSFEPRNAAAWLQLGSIQQAQGLSLDALTALRRCVELKADAVHHSSLLMGLSYVESVTPPELLDAHREWNAAYTAPPIEPVFGHRPGNHDRVLRLGLISSEFCRHPVGYLALSAVERLDRTRCSVVCYSRRVIEDDFSSRFHAAADVWRPAFGRKTHELAAQIRNDRIDVLVDLMGHTSATQLLLFACRPAPVQMTWLGYVGTTGLNTMDYLLADRFHVRPDEEKYYTETVLRMPNGYACYEASPEATDVASLPALGAGRVTFGCFNNPAKYAPRTMGAWAKILRHVPGSQLLLKYRGLDDADVQARLRAVFSKQGILQERVVFEGWSQHSDLLATYNRVDIALDTQPYSGGVTTCEALWMGVPVITFPGKTFAGRHATSHLMNAGYPQFVAEDLSGYIELAVRWANRLDELAEIRAGMREQIRKSPLCDAPRFANDFLDVIEQAWQSRVGNR